MFVVFLRAHQLAIAAHDVNQIAMADHRALWLTRRARGVNQDRQVFGLADIDARFPFARMLNDIIAAELPQRVQAQYLRVGKSHQALRIEHDNFTQLRRARANRENFVELLFIFDEHENRVGIVCEIFALRCRIGRVDAVHHAARA